MAGVMHALLQNKSARLADVQRLAKLKERDLRCELLIYEDEGHGLARLSNRLDAFPRALAFLDEVLQHGAPGAVAHDRPPLVSRPSTPKWYRLPG